MASHFRFAISLGGFLASSALAMSETFAASPIRIDDEQRYPFEELYSEPLQGFRAFPIELFAVDFRKGSAATIGSQVFFEALQKSDSFKNKMSEAGVDPSSASWEQIGRLLEDA